jgi:thymidylate synthase (FAD)
VHPQLFKWAGPSCVFRENTSRKEPAELRRYIDGEEGFTIPRCPELVENKAVPGCLRAAARPLHRNPGGPA